MSLRRSSLQFNIRPWQLPAAGQSVATAGATSSIRQSAHADGAFGARKKKRLGFAPTASDRTVGWDGSRYVGETSSKIIRSRPCSRPPSTSMRARGRWRRWPCSCGRPGRACPRAAAPASSRPWPRASSPAGRGIGPLPGPLNGGWRSGSARPVVNVNVFLPNRANYFCPIAPAHDAQPHQCKLPNSGYSSLIFLSVGTSLSL